ncbi:hypothetical protein FRACYDRAFT_258494 [Fragilariopsis cylindrus CCMP1102]|uniref:Uncharacterized protein n=1 Tax=Fragilariopsis cylindrus CCMP1102 TaxID=635003 RepID=A0A1E7EIL2_9STRA|nr:hypothetical protein FRACYDRAFT_258494 [Fragilariopsis cylindrus CCMP1102]|eukprot:OEU05731.1 hypothetical protein FRACYDRAFT_258494 [Fragilariopsis cylindrus CCMP1102]
MKRQWRPDTRHRVVQISKVYSFPHHDDRPPILFGEESLDNKTPEGSTNGSTWSLCVVQDALVDRKYEKLVSEHETMKKTMKLENRERSQELRKKSNLKSAEINSLKSSLKSLKSKNQALKLENISLKSKAATQINSLKSSLKSHKSKNEALKLENISLKSKAATLERQNKSIRNANMSANDNKDTTGDNDNDNNDVSSDLPPDASDAACSSNFITTDKIWERTFQPGSTRINNELIVCAVFKTILQSAEKIHIYPVVGENAINRIDRYLDCICTDLKDKIAGENEAKSEKFRGNAIYNIRKSSPRMIRKS